MEQFLLSLVTGFGYIGVFLASAISSATIFLPVPGYLVIPFAVTVLDPLFVGIAAGIGSALGEMTGYGVGFGSGRLAARKKEFAAWFARLEKLFARHNGMLIIFVFSSLPLPFDALGLFCGAIKYDAKKFFIAGAAGKTVRYVTLSYAAAMGIHIIDGLF
ncbi:MAG: VTT domain-containing protein [Candidatus Aenigmarchaeota archaeon]|nr:VTT domain-containing protein [Candidatus Aenigmarchaeota archaeon]